MWSLKNSSYNLVDRLLVDVGREPAGLKWLGNELYDNKYIKSIADWNFDKGRISVKQRAFVEELLLQMQKHWYYYEVKDGILHS